MCASNWLWEVLDLWLASLQPFNPVSQDTLLRISARTGSTWEEKLDLRFLFLASQTESAQIQQLFSIFAS